jgi:two-component system, cell cycle response regulator DivK
MPARILYVEDNPQNMRLVRKILMASGYEVLEAANGLSGVAMAAKEMPDLILMDVNLPDINGLEAASRLKASPQLSWIPIVALTANAMHGDRENCLAAGCDGYLAKPVMKNELLNTVALFLKQSPQPPLHSNGSPVTPPAPNGNGAHETTQANREPQPAEPPAPTPAPQ